MLNLPAMMLTTLLELNLLLQEIDVLSGDLDRVQPLQEVRADGDRVTMPAVSEGGNGVDSCSSGCDETGPRRISRH